MKQRNKNLSEFHKFQVDLKKQKAEEDFVKAQEDSYKTKIMLQNEQDEFLKYAEGWVREYHNQGKDINPLILDLKSYQKKVYYG
jgi:hypothetical protein